MVDYKVEYPTLSSQVWPHELVAGELDQFYGNPRGIGGANSEWEAENLIAIVPPWQMTEDGVAVTHIKIHKKCADSLQRILNAVWEYAGHDQAKINAAHLNEWGGSYNYRQNVNAPSKLSLHAYGAAFDIAPNENPNGKVWVDGSNMLPRWFIDACLAEGWCWGGDFNVTKDAMHFQATFNAHTDAPQAQPASMPVSSVQVHTTVAVPVPDTTDARLARMRQFLLNETGIPTEVENFKASILKDIQALRDKINAFNLALPQSVPAPAPAPVPIPIKPVPIPTPAGETDITATVFGGVGDTQGSAYPDVQPGWPNNYGVALPYHFLGTRPKVIVINKATGKSATADIVDVGPWNIKDPYWQNNARPQAETGVDMSGRKTNLAGIDLTPALAQAIGIDGKGKVDWSFVTTGATQMSNGTPVTVTVPVASALSSKINWTSAVQIVATLLTLFSGGKIGLTTDQQVAIVGVISTIAPLATMAFRTFGTTTITPQSLPN